MEDLPTEYDVIVVGTGMTGSIIAAALSRVGKAVLHLDENNFYGEEWASFNLESIESWLNNKVVNAGMDIDHAQFVNESETFVPLVRSHRCKNIQHKWIIPEDKMSEVIAKEDDLVLPSTEKDNINSWTRTKLVSEHRKFNLDLSPRMLYSRGDLVELLITSNIARYAEFRSVTRVLTWRGEKLEVVPCSRADVFATKHVSVVQKRMLVKILTQFAEYPKGLQEFQGFENKPFVDYLKHKKLDEQLIHYIVYAIAMGDYSTPCLEAVASSQRFLQSLGRYGNTPFICPMYGSGDLPQCFCRLCAVFGGIYHLGRTVDGLIVNKEKDVTALISGGQRLNAKHFVLTSSLCPPHFLTPQPESFILRTILLTDRSLVESEKEAVTLLQFPPCEVSEKPVTLMEMGGTCHVCPPGLFVVHLTTESNNPDSTLLEHVQKTLFADKSGEEGGSGDHGKRPNILWSLTWSMNQGAVVPSEECPSNLKMLGGPDASIDFDSSVAQAKEIFNKLYPDEEFLPRAPDPEEILLDDVETHEEESHDETSHENSSEEKIGDSGVVEALSEESSNNYVETNIEGSERVCTETNND